MQADKSVYKQIISILFTCVILLGAFVVLSPFLLAIIWAGIIATSSWSLHSWSLRRCGGRSTAAAFLTTLIICFVLVGPMVLLAIFVIQDFVAFASYLIHANRDGAPAPAWLGNVPWVGEYALARWNDYLATPEQLSGFIHETLAAKINIVQSTAQALLFNLSGRAATLFFALWVLFFFYRDGPSITARINQIGYTWLERRWPAYANQLPDALRAAVNGLIIVGFGEAVLLSLLFWACGIPSAVLFGVFTAMLAFVPMAAPLLLAILGAVLFASDASAAGVTVIAVGLLIVLGADYAVRPALIRGGTRLPFLGILFGIFGGVITMGIVGLLIGPVILVLLVVFIGEAALGAERSSGRADPAHGDGVANAPTPEDRKG